RQDGAGLDVGEHPAGGCVLDGPFEMVDVTAGIELPRQCVACLLQHESRWRLGDDAGEGAGERLSHGESRVAERKKDRETVSQNCRTHGYIQTSFRSIYEPLYTLAVISSHKLAGIGEV